MPITPAQKKFLRAKAHHLNPVVSIGQKGITDTLIEEAKQALAVHELIKIKLPADDKAAKRANLSAICTACDAQAVQLIGRIGVAYRAAEKPSIALPKS